MAMHMDVPRIRVAAMEGRKLRCTAGRHVIIADRKTADGGSDAGCTSGELLLVATGSCAAGTTRRYLHEHGLPLNGLAVEVSLKPAPGAGARDIIVIEVLVSAEIARHHLPAIENTVRSGGVVGRLMLGSEIEIQADVAKAGGKREDKNDVA